MSIYFQRGHVVEPVSEDESSEEESSSSSSDSSSESSSDSSDDSSDEDDDVIKPRSEEVPPDESKMEGEAVKEKVEEDDVEIHDDKKSIEKGNNFQIGAFNSAW